MSRPVPKRLKVTVHGHAQTAQARLLPLPRQACVPQPAEAPCLAPQNPEEHHHQRIAHVVLPHGVKAAHPPHVRLSSPHRGPLARVVVEVTDAQPLVHGVWADLGGAVAELSKQQRLHVVEAAHRLPLDKHAVHPAVSLPHVAILLQKVPNAVVGLVGVVEGTVLAAHDVVLEARQIDAPRIQHGAVSPVEVDGRHHKCHVGKADIEGQTEAARHGEGRTSLLSSRTCDLIATEYHSPTVHNSTLTDC